MRTIRTTIIGFASVDDALSSAFLSCLWKRKNGWLPDGGWTCSLAYARLSSTPYWISYNGCVLVTWFCLVALFPSWLRCELLRTTVRCTVVCRADLKNPEVIWWIQLEGSRTNWRTFGLPPQMKGGMTEHQPQPDKRAWEALRRSIQTASQEQRRKENMALYTSCVLYMNVCVMPTDVVLYTIYLQEVHVK